MLEGGGVKNDGGAIAGEDFGQEQSVRSVAEQRNVRGRLASGELGVDFVKIVLGVVEEKQARGLPSKERKSESGADATSGSSDEDGLAGESSAQRIPRVMEQRKV